MKLGKESVVLMVVGAAACVAGLQFPEVKQSGFDSVAYVTSGGAGYCLSNGELARIRVDKTTDGWSASGARGWPGELDGDGNCVASSDGLGECVELSEFGPIEVKQEDIDELQELLGGMPERDCREDSSLACDLCLVMTLEVDGETVPRDCCGDLNDGFGEDFDAVVNLLSTLVPTQVD